MTLSEAIEQWYLLHGQYLSDHKYRRMRLLNAAHYMQNPLVSDVSAKHFAEYRAKRIEQGIKPETMNHELRYFKALFNELNRLDVYKGANPVAKIRQIKVQKLEFPFLTHNQVDTLLKHCAESSSPDILPVTKLCLSTGARWCEAINIRVQDFYLDLYGYPKVKYTKTKNGSVRHIPISKSNYHYYQDIIKQKKLSEGRIFTNPKKAFHRVLDKAGIKLPPQHKTKVLRHTYASHQVMNGTDLRALQQLLGHSSLEVTQIYAHLAPHYLRQSVNNAPV